jgi:hypothetical protein
MRKLPLFTLIVVIAAIAFKLWLFSGLSVGIDAMAMHDDFLFIRQANSILNGKWLGDFNNLTLVKGPFYPVFLTLSHKAGLPLILTQQLLYALACILAALPLAIVSKRFQKTVFVGSFLILLFNPFSFDGNLNLRINRPAIYQSLGLLVIGCLLNCLVLSNKPKGKYWQIAFLALAGVFFSLAWLTREESIWLLGPIVLTYLALLRTSFRKSQTVSALKGISISIVSFLIFLFPVLSLNKNVYGRFIITELQHPAFVSAYAALTRVKHESFVQYLPVPKDVRTKIAGVSPSFASINTFLEGRIGNDWAEVTKAEAPLKNGEFDIGGLWFLWALRDAVSAAGYYRSLPETLLFYEKLANEVNRACDKKQLDCLNKRSTPLPPWNNNYLPSLGVYSRLLLKKLFFFSDIWPYYEGRSSPSSNYSLAQTITLEKPKQISLTDIRIRIILLIKRVYEMLFLPVFISGATIYAFQIFKNGRFGFFSPGSIMILTVFSGFFVLGVILILYATMAFPWTMNTGYMGPLPPFLYLTTLLMFITAINLSLGERR